MKVMAESIKLENNICFDSSGISHNRKKLSEVINNTKIETIEIINLELYGGDTYQLNLPENTIFVEPLLFGDGSDYCGGQFLKVGGSFSYFNNTNLNPGVFIRCNDDGLISISNYDYHNTKVTGFRIYYLKKG